MPSRTKHKGHAAPRPKKSLGQNFLRDQSVVEAILEGAEIGPSDLVVEVGPGQGALTIPAARRAGRLVAVELDRQLLPLLEKRLRNEGLSVESAEAEPAEEERSEETPEAEPKDAKVRLLQEDFLKLDLTALIQEERAARPELARVVLLGNLPYYITTPILMKVLEEGAPVDSMSVMMQKEVGERIHAEVGSKAYGALTVAIRYYCTSTKILDVDRSCFSPVPKVDSVVLRLDRRQEKEVHPREEARFFACIRTAFSMRRKTLGNCFTGFEGMDKQEAAEALEAAGIDPGRRGETLTIEEFAVLADRLGR